MKGACAVYLGGCVFFVWAAHIGQKGALIRTDDKQKAKGGHGKGHPTFRPLTESQVTNSENPFVLPSKVTSQITVDGQLRCVRACKNLSH